MAVISCLCALWLWWLRCRGWPRQSQQIQVDRRIVIQQRIRDWLIVLHKVRLADALDHIIRVKVDKLILINKYV